MQENEGIKIRPRRKGRSPEQIAELVREFAASELTHRQFCEDGGIALSELQRSLKIFGDVAASPGWWRWKLTPTSKALARWSC